MNENETQVLAQLRKGATVREVAQELGAEVVQSVRKADSAAYGRAVRAGIRRRRETRRKDEGAGDTPVETGEPDEPGAEAVNEPIPEEPKAKKSAGEDSVKKVAQRKVPKSEAVTSKDKAKGGAAAKPVLGGRIALYVGGAVLAVVAAVLIRQYLRRQRAEEARNRERVARMMEGKSTPPPPTAHSDHASPSQDSQVSSERISRLADEYQYRRSDGGQLGARPSQV